MRRITLVPAALLVGTVLILSGCSGITDVTKEDRANKFVNDISNTSSFSNVGDSIHPDASQKDQADTDAFWNTTFQHNTAYSISGLSISGDVGTASFSGGTYNGATIQFTFKNDAESAGGFFGGESDNYKILRLRLDGSTVIQ